MAETPTPPANPAGAAASAAKGGSAKLVGFLQTKQFGMPRWAFLALIVGGVGLGLYLRSRQRAAEMSDEEAESEIVPEDAYMGELAPLDPGLEGAGILAGPSGGSVVPVTTPTIPEGFPEIFDVLGLTIGDLALSNSDGALALADQNTILTEQLAGLAGLALTGGGTVHQPPHVPKPRPGPGSGGGKRPPRPGPNWHWNPKLKKWVRNKKRRGGKDEGRKPSRKRTRVSAGVRGGTNPAGRGCGPRPPKPGRNFVWHGSPKCRWIKT